MHLGRETEVQSAREVQWGCEVEGWTHEKQEDSTREGHKVQ